MTQQEKYMNRPEAAEYVRSKGAPCTKGTLQKLATIGGGPEYRKFGNRALYLASELDIWVSSKISGPRFSTSQVQVQR